MMLGFLKKLFPKRCADESENTTTTTTKDHCFICGEEEDETQKLEYTYIVVDPTYGINSRAIYHRECVKQIVCNADNLPVDNFDLLIRAIQVVQQWKEDEIRRKKDEAEFIRQLHASKLFICGETE
jgi:hypothetical protein